VRPSSLAVIGLGAIGGSLAWQARLAGVRRVVGYSPSRSEGVAALRASAVSEVADSPARAVQGADLVVLAVPPGPTLDLIGRLGRSLEPGATLTDVCSVKAPVMARAADCGLGDRFAGGHPLAGTHDSGFSAARPDRLRGCVVYVCESRSEEGARAARSVMRFWEEVLEAHPILGGVSYGTGARDTTRLAASSPDMWLDILVQNAGPLSEGLSSVETGLAELRRLIESGDRQALEHYLETAREFRRGLDR
jgi:prephenate dehydrogenase